MRTRGLVMAILAVGVCVSTPAFATIQRTFVSSHGSDANPCSISAPCRSFGAAIAQTTDGGDVVVLDSAGYGPVAVTNNVAITAPPGVFAGVTVFSGTGVDVATGGLKVVVRGLTITGIGGNVGVHVRAASDVTIERCDVASMLDYGIRADAAGASLYVSDTTVRRSAIGISLTGAIVAKFVRTGVHGNAGDGIDVFDGATAEIRDSDVSRNGNGINVTSAGSTGFLTGVTLDGVAVSQNSGDGLWLFTIGGHEATAGVARSTVSDNGGRGVRVESTASGDVSRVSIADSQFLRNQIGVDFVQHAPVGGAFGSLARNTFTGNLAAAVKTDAYSGYLSGGGNLTGPGDFNSPPVSNTSF